LLWGGKFLGIFKSLQVQFFNIKSPKIGEKYSIKKIIARFSIYMVQGGIVY
jgi:hypothetical protein